MKPTTQRLGAAATSAVSLVDDGGSRKSAGFPELPINVFKEMDAGRSGKTGDRDQTRFAGNQNEEPPGRGGTGSLRRRVERLPQFVTVHGGAYFFLPGRRALRYIASEK